MQEAITPENSLAKFFEETPTQWGLRGDSSLWQEMKEKLASTALPDSTYEFEVILHDLFKELTGVSVKQRNNVFVERYEGVGLSSGTVSSAYWIKTLIPLLLKRFRSELY
mgnify:CR=1 FL=1